MENLGDLKRTFSDLFGHGGKIRVVRAPGRVNLIGEHTDYNDGFVFPMAIEPQVLLLCRKREDEIIRLASTFAPGQVVRFSLVEPIESGEPTWANYSRGITAELLGVGIPLVGMDILITSTLPVGGGLSSSAALEVGTGRALLTLAGQELDPMRLALLSQKAEHEYAHVPCGIMDQMIVATAQKDHATLFDCRDFTRRLVPILADDLRVFIANSQVRHELAGGEYAQRRQQCEEAVAYFRKRNPSVKALRDVDMPTLLQAQKHLDEVIFKRARHVISENARTVAAAEQLEKHNYEQCGQLMVQSHQSLRDDYQVSIEQLDYLVEQAVSVKGVYGARMTGGGFGGCIVALVQPRAVEALRRHVQQTYQEKYGKTPDCFVTTATASASVVE